jgi:ubiquinone biosynthesis protein UbiJ
VYASAGLFIMTITSSLMAQAQAGIRDALLAGLERALNHLLRAEPWAREKLLPHTGKQVCFCAEPVRLVLQVSEEGSIQTRHSEPERASDVTLTLAGLALPTALLVALGRETSQALLKHVRIEGDADFAAAVAELLQKLRWDIEEDLSHYVGDIAAHRAISTARAVKQQLQDTQQRLWAQFSDYYREENSALISRQQLQPFVTELYDLDEALQRFEKRLQQSSAVRHRP